MSSGDSPAMRFSRNAQVVAGKVQELINESAGEPVAFTLLVFTEGRASYIGSAPRDAAIRELKNLLEVWESDSPDVPAHEAN